MKTLIVKSITKISIASICSIGIVDGLGRISDGIKAIADSNIYAEDFKHMRWSQEFDREQRRHDEWNDLRAKQEQKEAEKEAALAKKRLEKIAKERSNQ